MRKSSAAVCLLISIRCHSVAIDSVGFGSLCGDAPRLCLARKLCLSQGACFLVARRASTHLSVLLPMLHLARLAAVHHAQASAALLELAPERLLRHVAYHTALLLERSDA